MKKCLRSNSGVESGTGVITPLVRIGYVRLGWVRLGEVRLGEDRLG